MKKLKKDNKGFSLVELIVVVLIMAIIAVALAPQVMKWVNNSRITADQNACGNIKSAVQAAIADYQAHKGVMSDVTFTVNGAVSGLSITGVSTTGETKTFEACVKEALGTDERFDTKIGSAGFYVACTANGGVQVTCAASTSSLQ